VLDDALDAECSGHCFDERLRRRKAEARSFDAAPRGVEAIEGRAGAVQSGSEAKQLNASESTGFRQ
jgi:hypothetical protein